MNVASLQLLLRNQAHFAGEAGASQKVVGDIEGVAAGLEPFREMKFADLHELLRQAHDYKSTGILPVKSTAKSRAVKAPPEQLIRETTQRLVALYESALDPGFSHEKLDAELKSMSKLTVPNLKAVAKAFEIVNIPSKKGEIIEAFGRKIKDRREFHRLGG